MLLLRQDANFLQRENVKF